MKKIFFLCVLFVSMLFYIPVIREFTFMMLLLFLLDVVCCIFMTVVFSISYKVYVKTKKKKVQYINSPNSNIIFIEVLVFFMFVAKGVLLINKYFLQVSVIGSCILLFLSVALMLQNYLIFIVDGSLNTIRFSLEIKNIESIKCEQIKMNYKVTFLSDGKEYKETMTEEAYLRLKNEIPMK